MCVCVCVSDCVCVCMCVYVSVSVSWDIRHQYDLTDMLWCLVCGSRFNSADCACLSLRTQLDGKNIERPVTSSLFRFPLLYLPLISIELHYSFLNSALHFTSTLTLSLSTPVPLPSRTSYLPLHPSSHP